MAWLGSPQGSPDLEPRRVPMDRCWSVPFASSLSAFLLVMNSSCYGFLYVLFTQKYGITHGQAAWPSSGLVIAGTLVCLVVSQLQDKVSVYHITLVGGFLASLGLVASAFAPSISWMTFTFGVLHGTVFRTYFLSWHVRSRRRASAADAGALRTLENVLVWLAPSRSHGWFLNCGTICDGCDTPFGWVSGAGIGTALLGYSLYILLYFKKYSGTAFAIMWITRAFSGMAGTQILWHLANTYGVEGCLLITGSLLLHVVPITMFIKSPSPTSISFCSCTKKRREKPYNPYPPNTLSNTKKVSSPQSHNIPKVLPSPDRLCATTSSFASAMASMKTWPFYVAVFYSAMCEYLFVTFNATVVAYGVDKGCTLEDSKQVVLYNSMGLLVGRVVIPFATDKISSSRSPVAVGSFLVAAMCFFLLTSVSTYAGIVVVASVMGVAQGYVLCIKSVIVSDHVGLECFTFCCGVGGLLSLPLWLSGPSIIGFFREKKGSYHNLYVMLGILCLVHAVLLGLLTWREAKQRRQQREQRIYDSVVQELQSTKEICAA